MSQRDDSPPSDDLTQATLDPAKIETTGPVNATPGEKPSLKRKTYHSARWAVVGAVSASVLRLVSSLILTRLLMPEVFGLMGLVRTVISGFELFTDIGVGYAIIKEKRGDDPNFLNTAWTVQILRNFGLWAVIAIAAWPLARFYEEPLLGPLLTASGMGLAIAGFNSTSLVLFRRRLEVNRTVRLQITTSLVNLAVAAALAWMFHSVWAIVIASLVSALYKMLVSHKISPTDPNRLHWDTEVVRQIFRFGRWIFVSTALMYLSQQLDRLMLGKMIPMALLGAYVIANNVAQIPRNLLGRMNETVIFPAISRRVDLPRPELRAKLIHHRRPLLMLVAVGLAVLAGVGDLLLLFLYPDRLREAAWMLPIMVLGLWPRSLNLTMNGALRALGQLHYNPIGSVLRIALIGFGLPVAYRIYGLPGVIVVVALGDVPDLITNNYGRWRHGLATWIQDLGTTLLLFAVFGAVVAARQAMGLGSPFDAIPWPALAAPIVPQAP